MNTPFLLKSTRYVIMMLLFILCLPDLIANSPVETEKKVISLSDNWNQQMDEINNSIGLKVFCSNDERRKSIFVLLDEIHTTHDLLEEELKSTSESHSRRYISRILKHMDKLDEKYHPEAFARFFSEHCAQNYKIKRNPGDPVFGLYSDRGKVYTNEVITYRYLKRLTRQISRIRKHVEHYYIRRMVWES